MNQLNDTFCRSVIKSFTRLTAMIGVLACCLIQSNAHAAPVLSVDIAGPMSAKLCAIASEAPSSTLVPVTQDLKNMISEPTERSLKVASQERDVAPARLDERTRSIVSNVVFSRVFKIISDSIAYEAYRFYSGNLSKDLAYLKSPDSEIAIDAVVSRTSEIINSLKNVDLDLLADSFSLENGAQAKFGKQVLETMHLDRPSLKLVVSQILPQYVQGLHLKKLQDKYSQYSMLHGKRTERLMQNAIQWVALQVFGGATIVTFLPELNVLGGLMIASAPFVNAITISAIPLAAVNARGFFAVKVPSAVNALILKYRWGSVQRRLTKQTMNHLDALDQAARVRQTTMTEFVDQAAEIKDAVGQIEDFYSFSTAYTRFGRLSERISSQILAEALRPPSHWAEVDKILRSILALKNRGARSTTLSTRDQLMIHRDVLDLERRIKELDEIAATVRAFSSMYKELGEKVLRLADMGNNDSRLFVEFLNGDYQVGFMTLNILLGTIKQVQNSLAQQQNTLKSLETIDGANLLSEDVLSQIQNFIDSRDSQKVLTHGLMSPEN